MEVIINIDDKNEIAKVFVENAKAAGVTIEEFITNIVLGWAHTHIRDLYTYLAYNKDVNALATQLGTYVDVISEVKTIEGAKKAPKVGG